MAFGSVALAYSVRHSRAHGKIFPNAVPVAVFYAICRRHFLDGALVHGGELRQYDHRLFRYVLLLR